MIITFAYVESDVHARDIKSALKDKLHPAIIFTLDVAAPEPANFTGPSFTAAQADNDKFQLYARKRRTQLITTKPNLLLSSFEMITGKDKGKLITYRDMLVRWYWAQGFWIYTGQYDLTSNDATVQNLVKCVRGADDIQFQRFNNIRWAVFAQLNVELESAE